MGVEGREKHVCATPTSIAACLALGVNFLPMLLDLNSSLLHLSRLPVSQECQSHISQPLGLHLLFPSLLPLALPVSPGSLLSHPALCLPRLPTHTNLTSRYSNCFHNIFPTMAFLSLLRQDSVLLCQFLELCLSPSSFNNISNSYGDGQRELGCFTLEKEQLWGDPGAPSSAKGGLKEKRERNLLHLQIVVGQGRTILN